MHYTGMEAMYGNFILKYDIDNFLLFILVGVVLASLALYIGIKQFEQSKVVQKLAGSSAIISAAITGMHYMGMKASHFLPTELYKNRSEGTRRNRLIGYGYGEGICK